VGHALETTCRSAARGRDVEAARNCASFTENRTGSNRANTNSSSVPKANYQGNATNGRMDVGFKTPVDS